jgi:hypothetical protein
MNANEQDRREAAIGTATGAFPGETASVAGAYEQLNVFGRSTGIRVNVGHGHLVPAAPRVHYRMLSEEDADSTLTAILPRSSVL